MVSGRWALRLGVAAGALGAVSALTEVAHAGSFAVREQSTTFQGMSFAGNAAGHHLSSMFWNSAAAASVEGFNTETHAALLIADTSIDADGGLFVTGLALPPEVGGPIAGREADSGSIADAAVIPSSYTNYQLSDRLYLGLAINSPFGLVTKPDNDDWAGSPIAETSELFTLNVNPNLAYRVLPNLTVGVGLQAQYIDVRLSKDSFVNPANVGLTPEREIEGDDIAFGATAGILWDPMPGTTLGLGFRSAMEVELEGDYKSAGFTNPNGPLVVPPIDSSAKAKFFLPEQVTFSLRQNLTPQLAVLGTVEWTNWSRLGEVDVKGSNGETLETLAFNYEDGWFYAVGLEYMYSPSLTLRTGLAFEESPITDKTRNVLLPDNDRIWLSFGATYKYSERLSFDLAYTHIFVDDGDICRAASGDCENLGPQNPILVEGEAESSVDIISASIKYKISDPVEPLEPLK